MPTRRDTVPPEPPGTLYLIPTPISPSAADIPPATAQVVRNLTYCIVENEKSARRQIKLIAPERPVQEITLVRYDEHSADHAIESLLGPILQGKDGGLMSEAGCPCIADPGSKVVRRAQTLGIRVVPLVGPSSILLALMASGMEGQRFTFHGYLPHEESVLARICERIQLEELGNSYSHLFIETPYRVEKARMRLQKFSNLLDIFEGKNFGSNEPLPNSAPPNPEESAPLSVFVVSKKQTQLHRQPGCKGGSKNTGSGR